ncbi:MAG TPA: hypothetical protein VND67_01220 [Acidimicrobiales bacterium]|nr:hypothetical protein [Acidimicrobiales bacterium]
MLRKMLLIAAAVAMPMGVIAAGVVGAGPASAKAIVFSGPPITCAFTGQVNFAPPGLSGAGSITPNKTSTTTTSGLTYQSCTGGTGAAGPFSAGGLAIVTKNTKCPKIAVPPSTCAKPNYISDQASGLASPATLASLGKSVKKLPVTIQGFTFKIKPATTSIISCPGGESGFGISGTAKSKPKSTYTSFTITVCLGSDFGGATTGNFVGDLSAGVTVPGVNIDPATSSISIS